MLAPTGKKPPSVCPLGKADGGYHQCDDDKVAQTTLRQHEEPQKFRRLAAVGLCQEHEHIGAQYHVEGAEEEEVDNEECQCHDVDRHLQPALVRPVDEGGKEVTIEEYDGQSAHQVECSGVGVEDGRLVEDVEQRPHSHQEEKGEEERQLVQDGGCQATENISDTMNHVVE